MDGVERQNADSGKCEAWLDSRLVCLHMQRLVVEYAADVPACKLASMLKFALEVCSKPAAPLIVSVRAVWLLPLSHYMYRAGVS